MGKAGVKNQKIIAEVFNGRFLKVSKFRKQIFLFSFEPKNEQIFLISALASKNGPNQKSEGTLLY